MNNCPTRTASLREAADVLRTYRRAALWKRKAASECQQGFFAAIPAACRKMPSRAKCLQHMANLGLQNRGWSVPSREKNDQKGRQMQQDAKNAPKKRLRAKNVPT